jgi:hypothetical protein
MAMPPQLNSKKELLKAVLADERGMAPRSIGGVKAERFIFHTCPGSPG